MDTSERAQGAFGQLISRLGAVEILQAAPDLLPWERWLLDALFWRLCWHVDQQMARRRADQDKKIVT